MANWTERLLYRWKVKLGSLTVAVLLFAYVQYSHTVSRMLNMRVERPTLPEQLTISSRIPPYMSVEVSGPREIMDFNVSDFRITLSNPRPEVGTSIYRVNITPELPEGMRATYDTEVALNIDRLMTRELPVDSDVESQAIHGMRLGYTTTTPSILRVVGPEKILSNMDRLHTERLSLAPGLTHSISRVMVTGLPEFVKLAANQPFDVNVSVQLLSDSMDPELNDKVTLVTDVPIFCANELKGLSMKVIDRNTVDILVKTKMPPTRPIPRELFTGTIFCPVQISAESGDIIPSESILNLPVEVNERSGKGDFEIIDVIPSRVSLEFSRLSPRTTSKIRQGFEEHLIR